MMFSSFALSMSVYGSYHHRKSHSSLRLLKVLLIVTVLAVPCFYNHEKEDSFFFAVGQSPEENAVWCDEEHGTYDIETSRCQCRPGMYGPGCRMCTDDNSCYVESIHRISIFASSQAAVERDRINLYDDVGSINATNSLRPNNTSSSGSVICSKNLAVREEMHYKQFFCDLGKGIEHLLPVAKIGLYFNLSARTGAFALYEEYESFWGYHNIHCKMYDCSVAYGTANINCDLMQCQCDETKCSDFAKVIVSTGLNDKPVNFTYRGDNVFAIQPVGGLAIPLTAICNSSNCVHLPPPEPSASLNNSSSSNNSTNGTHYDDDISTLEASVHENQQTDWTLLIILLGGIGLISILFGCILLVARRPKKRQDNNITSFAFVELDQNKILTLEFLDLCSHVVVSRPKTNNKRFNSQPSLSVSVSDSIDNIEQYEEEIEPALNNNRTGTGNTMEKTILHNISSSIQSGSLLALLGPSGAGKTTLLNALAGVSNGKGVKLEGKILLNGVPRDSNFRNIAAFVQQDSNLLFSTLTVRECIEYSAQLRLPSMYTEEEVQDCVDTIIEELQIQKIAFSRIGEQSEKSRGISGGERRRVSVGMELVTNPKIIFLDEPTSGLDSYNANNIIQLLRSLSRKNRIVILSMHQPSAKSFKSCDQVMLLSGGTVAYDGTPQDAVTFFEDAGFACPPTDSIADHMLDVVSQPDNAKILITAMKEKRNNKNSGREMNVEEGADSNSMYQEGEHSNSSGHVNGEDIDFQNETNDNDNLIATFPNGGEKENSQCIMDKKKISFTLELAILLKRSAKNIWRKKALFLMHVLISVALGIISGYFFNDVQKNLSGFRNRMGAFFFVLTFFGFSSFSSIDLFISERSIFLREKGANYYGTLSYYLSKSILDALSLRVIPSILFSCIFYFIMGLQPSLEKFLTFVMALLLFNIASGSIIGCITILAPTSGTANLIATVVFLVMLLFGGFLMDIRSMAVTIYWLRYLSIFNYAFEIFITSELQGQLYTFDAPDFPEIPIYGEVFLNTLGLYAENINKDFIALAIVIVVTNSLGYLLLLFVAPSKKRTELYWKVRSFCEERFNQ